MIFQKYLLTFQRTHCIILLVKRISPSGVLFTKLYPLLIIYTPLIEKVSGSPAGLFSLYGITFGAINFMKHKIHE